MSDKADLRNKSHTQIGAGETVMDKDEETRKKCGRQVKRDIRRNLPDACPEGT